MIPDTSITTHIEDIHAGRDVTVAVAKIIQDSFNLIEKSQAGPELKDSLQELNRQVAELITKLPEDKAKQVAQDLDMLTKEAVSPKPRRPFYSVTAEGLKEAAKAVGEVAEPVIATVTKILGLLAVVA